MKINPFENNIINQKNESKIEYSPIRACIVDINKIDNYTKQEIDLIEKHGVNIDFFESKEYFSENKIINKGDRTYVFSDIDSTDKFSRAYKNCTGIIMVGEDKENGKQISFMSHQDPSEFLFELKNEFVNDLVNNIKIFKDKIKENTFDVVVFGGNYSKDKEDKEYRKNYKNSINLIGSIFKENFNIDPAVITGPSSISLASSASNLYFDTQNRRLFLVRRFQENNKNNHEYLTSNIKKIEKDWN